MSTYQQIIRKVTKCDEAEAVQIEDVMRDVIFCSTLDWHTREELESAARLGHEIIHQKVNENS